MEEERGKNGVELEERELFTGVRERGKLRRTCK